LGARGARRRVEAVTPALGPTVRRNDDDPPQPLSRSFDRRLFGYVLRAFHHAVDQSDHPAATVLYDVLLYLISSSGMGYRVEHRRSEHELADARACLQRLERRLGANDDMSNPA